MLEGWYSVAGAVSRGADKSGETLKDLDERYGISDVVRDKGVKTGRVIRDLNSEYGVTEKAAEVAQAVSGAAREAAGTAGQVAEDSRIYDAARTVSDPIASAVKQHGLDKRIEEIGRACEDLYGASRSVIKPYFLPETPDELLRNTRKELAYISACIMQISPGEAEKLASQFGTVVASKIAGVAASGALLSLVSG